MLVSVSLLGEPKWIAPSTNLNITKISILLLIFEHLSISLTYIYTMEYYILKEAVDTKETGRAYPQTLFKNQKKLNPNPFLLANKANEGVYPPEDLLPFDYLELARGAKLSDLMTSPFSMNGFLISKKLKELFEKESVSDCRYYPVVLFNKDVEIKDYFYFHSVSCLRSNVDYSKSKFSVTSADIDEFDLPVFSSYSDIKQYQRNLEGIKMLSAKQLYLNLNFHILSLCLEHLLLK